MSGQSSQIARNVIITLATQLLSWVLSFVVTMYLPRYIKDTGLGAMTLAASISSFLSMLVSLGTSTVLIKEIAKDKSRLGTLIVAGLLIRIPLGIAAACFGWIAAQLLGYSHPITVLILLSMAGMVIGQLTDVLMCALRALEDFPRQNAIVITEKFLISAAIISLILLKAPLWTIIAVGIFTGLVSLTLSVVSVVGHVHRANIHLNFALDLAPIRFLFVGGIPFLTTALFTSIYGQGDAVLLSKMSSVAAIGWYGLANRLAGSTMIIPVTLCSTMLPAMVRLFKEDEERFAAIVRRLLNLIIMSVIPFAAILSLAPARILELLHYPASFHSSVPVLVITGGGIVFWFLSQCVGTTLVACDRQNIFAKVTGFAAALSIPQCALLIWLSQRWFSNGAIGAVTSDVLLEAGMVVAYILYLPRGLFTRQAVTTFLKSSLAALPLVSLFLFAHGRAVPYCLGIGLLLYIPLCILLRCVDSRDLDILRGLLRRKMNA